MSVADNALVARRAYEAFSRRNLDATVADIADNAKVVSLGLGRTFNGKAGAAELFALWAAMADDGRVEIARELPGEEGITIEGVFEGTYTGSFMGPTGVVPAFGQVFSVPFAAVWRIQGAKVVSIHSYFDRLDLLQQLTEPHAPS